MWNTLGQAATVAQLVGADVGGLIFTIIQAAVKAQQNKKECEQLARRVFTVGELLSHLQNPEVLERPELRRPLAGLGDTLREAHKLVMACQGKNVLYRVVQAERQAERFRDVQSRIDSYLFLFPVISHLDITLRLNRIYNILVPNDMAAGPSVPAFSLPQIDSQQDGPNYMAAGPSAPAFSLPQITEQDSQDGPKNDWKNYQRFTFKKLAKATNNFAEDKIIGKGGFSFVYMGRLRDGRQVAIKRMNKLITAERMGEYNTEVSILHNISHKNIVRLIGYCGPQEKRRLFRKYLENKMVIVYEYLENRSLDLYLYDQALQSPVTASWKMRIEILLGVSRAIEYLQSYAERPVIHRDVKPSNIILDASWAPRLGDFGFALAWEGPDHEDKDVVGTIGFLAPEYAIRGALNLTTDVYSFGVVMLQVLTGKRAHSIAAKWEENTRDASEPRSLVEFTVPLIEAGELRKVLDVRPAAEPTPRQLEAVELVAQAAVRCLGLQWEARPSISEVVTTLETALELAGADG